VNIGLMICGLCVSALAAQAQYFPEAPDPTGPTVLTRGQIPPPDVFGNSGREDYFNGFLFLNAIHDSDLPFETFNPAGGVLNTYGGTGGQIGGGFNLYHLVEHGVMSASYNGSYTHYGRSGLSNGTNQTLSLAYSKMLSRRWTLRASEGLNYNLNFGSSFTLIPSSGLFPSVQPYSQRAFFNSTSVTLGYQESLRLSYFVGGDFFTAVYSPDTVGTYVGVSGTAGASYRITRRTTATGSYSISRLKYTDLSVTTDIGTALLTLSHELPRHWEVSLSGGVNQVNSKGTALLPIQGVVSEQFIQGQSSQKTNSPTLTASIFKSGRRSRVGISGGEAVSGGNGYYLTSRNVYVNGVGDLDIGRRLSLSGRLGYSKLSSLSNATNSYKAITYDFSAGFRLTRHTYLNGAYSGWHYPRFGPSNPNLANRVTVGVTFASANFPFPF
jgi:hypothetical protein